MEATTLVANVDGDAEVETTAPAALETATEEDATEAEVVTAAADVATDATEVAPVAAPALYMAGPGMVYEERAA